MGDRKEGREGGEENIRGRKRGREGRWKQREEEEVRGWGGREGGS